MKRRINIRLGFHFYSYYAENYSLLYVYVYCIRVGVQSTPNTCMITFLHYSRPAKAMRCDPVGHMKHIS